MVGGRKLNEELFDININKCIDIQFQISQDF